MGSKLPPGTLEKLWSDSANWRLNAVYVCKADPRILLPKRRKWVGWTLNFAHRRAWFHLIVGIGMTVAVFALLLATHHFIILALILVLSIPFSAWRASPGRFEERE
jgi:uncharacterized membrane protein